MDFVGILSKEEKQIVQEIMQCEWVNSKIRKISTVKKEYELISPWGVFQIYVSSHFNFIQKDKQSFWAKIGSTLIIDLFWFGPFLSVCIKSFFVLFKLPFLGDERL